jgi:hypothetical protein
MKSKLLFTLSGLLSSVASAQADFVHAAPQAEMDFLSAVRQVESGDRYDCPPGRAGELGAYQFRREVWSRYTEASFAQAQTPVADEVAARHYAWIAGQLEARGLAVSPWNLAVAWNSGLGTLANRRIPRATRDYADRVANLVQDAANLRRSLTPAFHIALASAN